jgi:hypothetical protein
LKSVGINGDDIVFTSDTKGIDKWMEGVHAIGGVVSRGKTLVNKHYFTVNSELWSSSGKVNCLRPSLITALTGDNRYFISPQYEWKEFRNCELVKPSMEKIFNLVEKLHLDLPRQYGGLGLVHNSKPNRSFDDRLFAAYKRSMLEKEFSHVYLYSERYMKESQTAREGLSWHGPRYPAWISRDMAKAFSKIYRSKAFNFRLKPHEIRFCLIELSRPDLFQSAYLEPFRKQFENLRFPNITEFEEDMEKRKGLIMPRLKEQYELMMTGLKRVEIPVNLIQAYNGLVEGDVQQAIDVDDEFRLDHGSLCRTDMEMRDWYSTYKGPESEKSAWKPVYQRANTRRRKNRVRTV